MTTENESKIVRRGSVLVDLQQHTQVSVVQLVDGTYEYIHPNTGHYLLLPSPWLTRVEWETPEPPERKNEAGRRGTIQTYHPITGVKDVSCPVQARNGFYVYSPAESDYWVPLSPSWQHSIKWDDADPAPQKVDMPENKRELGLRGTIQVCSPVQGAEDSSCRVVMISDGSYVYSYPESERLIPLPGSWLHQVKWDPEPAEQPQKAKPPAQTTQHFVAILPDGSEHTFQFLVDLPLPQVLPPIVTNDIMSFLQHIVGAAGYHLNPLLPAPVPVRVELMRIVGTTLCRTHLDTYNVTPPHMPLDAGGFHAACLVLRRQLPIEFRDLLYKFCDQLSPQDSFEQRYQTLREIATHIEQAVRRATQRIQDEHNDTTQKEDAPC